MNKKEQEMRLRINTIASLLVDITTVKGVIEDLDHKVCPFYFTDWQQRVIEDTMIRGHWLAENEPSVVIFSKKQQAMFYDIFEQIGIPDFFHEWSDEEVKRIEEIQEIVSTRCPNNITCAEKLANIGVGMKSKLYF